VFFISCTLHVAHAVIIPITKLGTFNYLIFVYYHYHYYYYHMKIKTKFIIVGIIALLLFIVAAETIRFSQQQKEEGYIINLAGRQRMLSQKVTKEWLQFQDAPSTAKANVVRNTADLFEQTLSAYLSGGTAPLTLIASSPLRQEIKEITNVAQLNQLKLVAGIWRDFSAAIKTSLGDSVSGMTDAELVEAQSQATAFILANNLSLLKESNKVVLLFQEEAAEQTLQNQKMQIVSTVLTAGLLVWLLMTVLRTLGLVAKMGARLNVSTTCLDVSCRELSESSQAVADSASDQANSLHEISSALEEISSICESNNSASEFTKNLTTEASALTEKGLADMAALNHAVTTGKESTAEMNDSMSKIQEASNSISSVIKTIDQIAFQTNILALNAAVEAARAGEAGAGFAVVADEVRQLAHRSSAAAKETTELIETSIARSANGVKACELVGQNLEMISEHSGKAGERLKIIASKSSDIDQSANEIQSAGREQLEGIRELDTAVTSLNDSTTGNAATAEETASVSMQISDESSELKKSVDVLRNLALTGKAPANLDLATTVDDVAPTAAAGGSKADEPKLLEFK